MSAGDLGIITYFDITLVFGICKITLVFTVELSLFVPFGQVLRRWTEGLPDHEVLVSLQFLE